MSPELAGLQAQVAAIQANVKWLTTLVWAMIGLNAVAFLQNSYVSAMIRRNNRGSKDNDQSDQ